jgi:hypothetical protein
MYIHIYHYASTLTVLGIYIYVYKYIYINISPYIFTYIGIFFGYTSPQKIELYEAGILFALYWLYVFIMYHNSTLKALFKVDYQPIVKKEVEYGTIEIEGAKPRRDEIIKWGKHIFVHLFLCVYVFI